MSQLDINNHSRPPSSLHHQNIDDDYNEDQKDLSATSKRYATYELNWRDDNSDYHSIDSISDNNIDIFNNTQNNDTPTNSAQAARWSLTKSLPPPTTPLPPIPQEQSQHNRSLRHSRKSTPITIDTTRRFSEPNDKHESGPQSPFGGITVTTIKVVEIHSPTENRSSMIGNDEFNKKSSNKIQRNNRPVPLNLPADPVGIITSERNERKQRINISPPPPLSESQPPPPLPPINVKNVKNGNKKLVNQDPKQKIRSSIINPQKIKRSKSKNGKKPEMVIPKEMAFIDPRLLANNKSLVRVQTTNRNRKTSIKRGGSAYRRRMPPKNLELSSTSNPVYSNDPTDMEADLPPIKRQMYPWLPVSTKPPQLLHASLVPLPHHVNRTNNTTSDSNNSNSLLLAPVNQKRNSRANFRRLSRINSQRKRASIIAPNPNRASLIFRRQILEESLMMSFGGMMGGVHQSQQPVSVPKPPIRKRTKKVSNAKVEDRETRRERRKKEKLEKRLGKKATPDKNNNQTEGINIEKLEDRDIEPKVESQKEIYMGPQPPPRKSPQDTTMRDNSPSRKRKNSNNSNALSLLSSPPERRLGNPNGSSLEPLTKEPPPFPAHLARSTSFLEHSNKEKSKRKQPPYPPLIGQSASSLSNYSQFTPSPSERNGSANNEDDINLGEASSIQQLSSPNKSQKTGGFLGFFNKPTSPPLSQISSPVLRPTQLSLIPQSPTTSIPLSSTTPPQSPPLSPTRTLRLPQPLSRVGKSRRGVESGPSSPPGIQDQEKLRKMEQFEALIANSETSSSKKPITGKIKAFTTAITTGTSSSSSSIITSNTSFEKKRKVDGTPRHSVETNSEREQINNIKRTSGDLDSVDSVHYRPGENSEFGMGDDGVIRMILTPEVCR